MTNEESIAYAEQASLEAGNPAFTTVVLTAGNNLCSDRGDRSGKGILSALKEKEETQMLKAVTVCRNEHTGRIGAGMMSGTNRKALLSLDPKNALAEIITVGLKGAILVDNAVTGGTECIISRPLDALGAFLQRFRFSLFSISEVPFRCFGSCFWGPNGSENRDDPHSKNKMVPHPVKKQRQGTVFPWCCFFIRSKPGFYKPHPETPYSSSFIWVYSPSSNPSFFSVAQRTAHSLWKINRLCSRRSCTHRVPSARRRSEMGQGECLTQ